MRFICTDLASRFSAWLVLAMVIGTTTVAVGQVTSGLINGTVKDATGAVIRKRHSHGGQSVDRRRTHGHHERDR